MNTLERWIKCLNRRNRIEIFDILLEQLLKIINCSKLRFLVGGEGKGQLEQEYSIYMYYITSDWYKSFH